ncbi:MAG: 50S ribosomal protein L6 [Nanoarchaeota archaeon]|nr:50S ribosomal protein L6 [Nanoarchaeota archaeon]
MSKKSTSKTSELKIPENVEVRIQGDNVIVKGPKGETGKKLADPKLGMQVKDGKFIITNKKISRSQKRVVNSFISHLKNLIRGATEGYVYKMKICSTHFPISASVESGEVVIKNFFGEKVPRKARILSGVQVTIDKDIITLEGTNKEDVGQTAANIEQICRITNRDRRIFQDGCWITHKAGKEI